MKLETLAKRIAEKTGEPVLERVILGHASIHDIPDRCMQWEGKSSGSTNGRVRKRRDYSCLPYQIGTIDQLRPVIRFQNREHGVHRLLVDRLMKIDFPLRLVKTCGTERCVNPLHFIPKEITRSGAIPPAQETEPNLLSDDWTIEEVEEVVEIALTEGHPANWEELMALPIMEEVSTGHAKAVLIKLNRPHLLPPA